MRDGIHSIVTDVPLKYDGVLHRFLNPDGVPYSAIYVGKTELFTCPREEEEEMIKCWNEVPLDE